MSETVIAELKVSDLSTLSQFVDLSDTRVTSNGLGLKLTEENLKALIKSGAIGKKLNVDSIKCNKPLEATNGLNADINKFTKRSRLKRNTRLTREESSTDFCSNVVENLRHTGIRRVVNSNENVQDSTQESSKQKGKDSKLLFTCKSSEEDNFIKPSPSKVSVNINTVEIRSESKSQTARSTSRSPKDVCNSSRLYSMCSASDCERNEADSSNVSTRSSSSKQQIDSFKTSSESESVGRSPKIKRLKKCIELPTSDTGLNNANAQSKLTRSKVVPLKVSSSEVSEDDVLLSNRTARSKTIRLPVSPCIESTLRSYGFEPDILAQNSDVESLRYLWEKAGTGARLVVKTKRGLKSSKTCYSIAIVTNMSDQVICNS